MIEKNDVIINENGDPLDQIKCQCDSCDDNKKSPKEKDGFIKRISMDNICLGISFLIFFTALLSDFTSNIKLALYILAYGLIARKILFSAIKSLIKGKMMDENFLMALASIVAFLIGEYAEGVAVMLFYRVGQLTEEYALNRSKSNISKLLDLKPDMARIKSAFGYNEVKPEAVKVGDILLVKPGEKIPLDGKVIKGETSIDTSMLTGESLPQTVEIDDQVYSGTLNVEGAIEVQVEKLSKDSAVSKILSLVKVANSRKAVTEKFITRFAKVYTPIVVLFAALIAVLPPLLLGQPFETWVYRGAIFLVVSCPCALVISIPLGYFGGIGGAARKGILVKGGHYLEVLKKSKTIILDKTGTLTKGNFKLKKIHLIEDMQEDHLLEIAAHLESHSTHPIALAVVDAYDKPLNIHDISQVKEISGKGVSGYFKDYQVDLGNKRLMELRNISLENVKYPGTVLYLAINGRLQGVFEIEDEIKQGSLEGINRLKKLGFNRLVMLTGDQDAIARSVGESLGIEEIYSELLPEDKLNYVEKIIEESSPVIFVGDGINDAPVLTRADVGISMGQLGSDAAIESSDVVLMKDEITKVAEAVEGARFTSKIIWQNIILALGTKAVIMILGTLGYASLWTAVFGDVGVAFLAILNAGRGIYRK